MGNGKVSVLIKKSSLIFDKYVNRLLMPYHLSNSQFRILMKLYKAPEQSVRQVDIETEFAMTNPTVTGLVKQLEKKGYVRRIENPNDKRSKLLQLTDYANSMRDEFFALADYLEQEMTDGLTEQEMKVLTELLQKVLKHHEG